MITAPRKASVFHHIEFMRLSERRVLVIMVAPDGDVQNRVIFTAQDYTHAQLVEASNYLNARLSGRTEVAIEDVREIAPYVLRHRIIVDDTLTPDDVLRTVLEQVPVPERAYSLR